jgi:hypothetical protein
VSTLQGFLIGLLHLVSSTHALFSLVFFILFKAMARDGDERRSKHHQEVGASLGGPSAKTK